MLFHTPAYLITFRLRTTAILNHSAVDHFRNHARNTNYLETGNHIPHLAGSMPFGFSTTKNANIHPQARVPFTTSILALTAIELQSTLASSIRELKAKRDLLLNYMASTETGENRDVKSNNIKDQHQGLLSLHEQIKV
jgi:hypothetical protein